MSEAQVYMRDPILMKLAPIVTKILYSPGFWVIPAVSLIFDLLIPCAKRHIYELK